MILSIVIPVLDSHEVVRRQLLHFERMDLPDDTEIILVDDGSAQPLAVNREIRELLDRDTGAGVLIIETNDTRPWTSSLARNAGADVARGDYLLMTDIDHILTKELIYTVRNKFDGEKMNFRREFAVLDEEGRLAQDRDTLTAYGLLPDAPVRVGTLYNNFAMSRKLFWKIGGYDKDLVDAPYPQDVDKEFRSRWHEYQAKTRARVCSLIPTMYLFPSGQFCGDVDYNPFGLFHKLSRKTSGNATWRRELRRTHNSQ
jgi:glycosyltransferase involved in cell wall biosynthesis